MRNTNQQAYDRGTTIFSPDGRLYQVEYAREAVKRGAPVVGVRGETSVVLATHHAKRSALVDTRRGEKLSSVDDHIIIGSAGHAADTRRLVEFARERAQEERLRFGAPATVESLSTVVADHIQEFTQTGGARPYGSALLVCGYDTEPRLFEIDPSGANTEWRATAVGRNADAGLNYLEERYDSSLAVDDTVSLALRGVGAAVDDVPAGSLDAVVVDRDGYRFVSHDRIGSMYENR